MDVMKSEVFSIGHSNLNYRRFAWLLRKCDVDQVIDIRSIPYSKHVPHFNFKVLREKLEKSRFKYEYLGNQLGTSNVNLSLGFEQHPDYRHQIAREAYKDGLDQLIKIARNNRVAIMCAEGNPYTCHRHTVLSDELLKYGLEMVHIFTDGRTVPAHNTLLPRRTKTGKFVQRGLFDMVGPNQPRVHDEEMPALKRVA